jgi:DNA-binding transcriptional MerR regulator
MARESDPPIYSIGAVARMLDVPASTLRAWEERYALITPTRSEGAHRLYSRGQVEKLRFIKSRIESGVSAADAHRLLADQLREGHVPAQPTAGFIGGRPLILIAELDSYAADLAEYFLRTEGWDVVIALDATQAKLHFEERSPDVVLLDLLLTGGAGFRLLHEFTEKHTAQVVAVSSLDSAGEAMAAGAAAFLRKPLDPLTLLSTIHDLLGSSALVERLPERRVER